MVAHIELPALLVLIGVWESTVKVITLNPGMKLEADSHDYSECSGVGLWFEEEKMKEEGEIGKNTKEILS